MVESRGIAVISYSVWFPLRSLKSVASNSCMKWWDAQSE